MSEVTNPTVPVTNPPSLQDCSVELACTLPYYVLGTQQVQSRIDEIHPNLAAAQWEVQRMRDVIAGSRTIKAKGTTYLPKTRINQDLLEYKRLKHHTTWFPATNRTLAGIKGLLLAKNVVLNAPALEPIKSVITRELGSDRDLAEQVVGETLQTNFTGLLVDHSTAPAGVALNAANALEVGFRPFVALYPCESIIWIDYGYQDNARKPIRVVLRESADRILELSLTSGIYQQHVHTREGGQYQITETRTPTKNGKPLDRLPFVIVSDNTAAWPQPSVLRDVAELNLQHYLQSSKIANLEMVGAGLVPFITGVQIPRDEQTGEKLPVDIDFSTGGFIVLEDAQAKATFMEPEGNLAVQLADTLLTIQDQMAKCGARVIASEKVAPEAAETVARRAASEDSTNASLALAYQRRISDALSWCSWWIDGSKAQFTLNTDYRNYKMSAQDRTIALQELQAGAISKLTYYMERRDNGIINSSDTFEEEQARIEQDRADEPPADTGL